jgi:hypothetical protein
VPRLRACANCAPGWRSSSWSRCRGGSIPLYPSSWPVWRFLGKTSATAGDWPAAIAAIDPGILPNAPVDSYSGQAFRLKRRDGQILIYSIGPDRKDEHRAFDPKHWMNGGPDDVGACAWDVPQRRQPAAPADGQPPAEGDSAD